MGLTWESICRCAAVVLLLVPAVQADTGRGLAAFHRGDYLAAWREFMEPAERGDAEAEARIGMMLFEKLNPPGTGIYADCERWLGASARHGNAGGMAYLGRFYYAEATRMMQGGTSAMSGTVPISLRQAANLRFIQAREWFARAAALGDGYAMSNLAVMLDAGIGGPRDSARAARLRIESTRRAEAGVAARATPDPTALAMIDAWQAGRHAEAFSNAQALANRGDAKAQALLGRAYYEGVGIPRDYNWALNWLDKSAAQGNADAMFFLGLMYEHGRGVAQDLAKALELFDRAAIRGQSYARMEGQGMRVQNGSVRGAAQRRANGSVEANACYAAGGTPAAGACVKDGANVDPYGVFR